MVESDPGPAAAVSVIVRNRNEAESLAQIFAALAAQSLPHEVVVVDNESTDGSQALAESHGAKVCTVASADFTYGGSLNAGMAETSHERVVVLSGHSIPVGSRFLEDATAPFDDPRVAAVRLLRADKTPELARWPGREGIAPPAEPSEIVAGGPIASGCAFRRSVWEQMPFDDTVDSDEDKVWAIGAVGAGHTIAVSSAVYAYSRSLGLIDSLQRESRSAMGVYRASGHRSRVGLRPTLVALVKGMGAAVIGPLWRYGDGLSIGIRSRRAAKRGALWRQPEGAERG